MASKDKSCKAALDGKHYWIYVERQSKGGRPPTKTLVCRECGETP